MNKESAEQNHMKQTSKPFEETGDKEQKSENQGEIELTSREALEERLNEAEAQVNALKDQLLRSQAEMHNLQKRHEKKMDDAQRYALQAFAKELLGVIDNFERALAESGSQTGPLFEGVQRTHELFLKAFIKFGLQQVNPMGEMFNPELHEAISTAPAENDVDNNKVIQVLQRGYLLNERLIRPALVIVAKK